MENVRTEIIVKDPNLGAEMPARKPQTSLESPITELEQISKDRYQYFTTWVLRGALVFHVLLLGLFLMMGIQSLALLNIASVALCLASQNLLKSQRYGAISLLIVYDIMIHVALTGMVIGWQSGFHYYVLLTPLLLYVNFSRAWQEKLSYSALVLAAFILMDFWLRDTMPYLSIDEATMTMMCYANLALALLFLASMINIHSISVTKAETRLHTLATTDSLTGLNNRRRMIEVAHQEISQSNVSRTPFAIVICDIDFFKHINDQFGHAAGDHVLLELVTMLNNMVRREDAIARWGGEEFLIILPGTKMAGAKEIAERIRQTVSTHDMEFEGQRFSITVTLGVSEYRNGEHFDQCVSRADAALYNGKQNGRNRVELEEGSYFQTSMF